MDAQQLHTYSEYQYTVGTFGYINIIDADILLLS